MGMFCFFKGHNFELTGEYSYSGTDADIITVSTYKCSRCGKRKTTINTKFVVSKEHNTVAKGEVSFDTPDFIK